MKEQLLYEGATFTYIIDTCIMTGRVTGGAPLHLTRHFHSHSHFHKVTFLKYFRALITLKLVPLSHNLYFSRNLTICPKKAKTHAGHTFYPKSWNPKLDVFRPILAAEQDPITQNDLKCCSDAHKSHYFVRLSQEHGGRRTPQVIRHIKRPGLFSEAEGRAELHCPPEIRHTKRPGLFSEAEGRAELLFP